MVRPTRIVRTEFDLIVGSWCRSMVQDLIGFVIIQNACTSLMFY